MFWLSSAVGRCALSVRRNGDGVPCLASSPTDSRVFSPTGHAFRFPAWSTDRVLMPWIVRRGIYRGVRENGITAS